MNIRNMGILQQNKEKARECQGDYVAIRRCNSDVVHCTKCDGSYARRFFYRHRARCVGPASNNPKPCSARFVHLRADDQFTQILERFHRDEVGEVCRSDATIQQIGRLLWDKDKAKVDKTDEVRKSVMTAMRSLARLFIEVRKTMKSDKLDASAMFDRKNWSSLVEAIDIITRNDTTTSSSSNSNVVKYGLKNNLYYLLMSSVRLLEGVALADTESDLAAQELAKFSKVLKHHENIIFSDAKYFINKSRQERLRLPSRMPDDQTMRDLRNFTVREIEEVSATDHNKSTFVHLRNLVCSRLTLFNALRGGEPSRITLDQWLQRNKWLHTNTTLDAEEKALFKSMQIMYMVGKGNHLVSCFVPDDCVQALDLLCRESIRCKVGVVLTNKFLFPNTEGSAHHVDGWHATSYVLQRAGIECSIINATNQRARISTMYASLEVTEEDRPYFFKHMGHTEDVNVGTYQRPLPVLAMTKVGAILAQMDASTASQGNPLSSNCIQCF